MSQTLQEPKSKSFSTYRSYQRIERDLREQIEAGRWAAGVPLPTRRNLALEYGVDRNTLQRAINTLLADGTLVSDGVRGTFVSARDLALAKHRIAIPKVADPGQMRFEHAEVRTGAVYGIIINSRIVGEYKEIWHDRVVHAAERTATAAGSATRFASKEDGGLSFYDAVEPQIRNMVEADSIAGAIVVSLHDGDQSAYVERLMRLFHIPIVYISSVEAIYPVPNVYYDQSEAGFQAARHVITQGHSTMTFVAPADMMWVHDRIQGAKSACRLAGLPDTALTVYPAQGRIDASLHEIFTGYEVHVDDLFHMKPPTAIIACNDSIALKIKAAGELAGKFAGRDYLLIGFDDSSESRANGLSTLAPPLEALGEEAAHLLPRLIDGTRDGTQVRLRSHLVQRASSGALVS